MKKIIIILTLGIASIAHADLRYHERFEHHDHYGYGMGWIGPAILGGIVTYELTRPATVPAPQPVPPVIVQQPPVIVQQQVVTVPPAPAGFHYENILDSACKCYRQVLIQN